MITLQNRRRIASNYLLHRGELVRNALLELDSAGRVVSLGAVESIDRLENTEFYSGILMPGFVNAHCHLELSYLQGAITPRSGFAGFATQLSQQRNLFSQSDMEAAAKRADAAMWREGIAAVGDISNSAIAASVKSQSPIHYHTFVEHFGLGRGVSTHLEPLLQKPNSSLTPHSTYSLDDAIFRHIATLDGSSPLSIHFMESRGERELFEGRGQLHEWYQRAGLRCDFLGYGSPAQRLVESIPPSRSLLLVHNTHITAHDIELLLGHFTAPLYWVVAPGSNDYIAGEHPPIELLQKYGLNICVGTDSLASNTSLSIVEELRRLKGVALAQKLSWATHIGAKALGVEELGTIEVGHTPSLIALSGLETDAKGKVIDIGENYNIKRIS